MKQIVMAGPRKSRIVDVPIPEITDDQLLVKVTYTGMCHSEWYPWTVARPGEVFGHETDRRRREVRPERDGVPGGGPGDRARRRRVQGVHRHGAGQDLPCAG